MTPSPSWQPPRSPAWMAPPGSSSGIPTRPRSPNRLLVNACIDEARRLRRHRVDVELTELDQSAVAGIESVVADRDELERGFLRLEPEMRAVIVLHYYLDLTMPDVAATLGIPVGTAKSRLNRALGLMRAALDADARRASGISEGRTA
jgi:DNA-directed RNA polymerase specialized sigma24 family protein